MYKIAYLILFRFDNAGQLSAEITLFYVQVNKIYGRFQLSLISKLLQFMLRQMMEIVAQKPLTQ